MMLPLMRERESKGAARSSDEMREEECDDNYESVEETCASQDRESNDMEVKVCEVYVNGSVIESCLASVMATTAVQNGSI